MAGYIGLAAIAGIIWLLFKAKKKVTRKRGFLGPVIVMGAAWYVLFTYVSPVVPGHAILQTVVKGPVPGGTLSCAGLEKLWIRAGGSRSAAFMAAEIARAESGGRQYARDPASGYYADGNVDIGYWQVNTVHGNIPYDPLGNAQAAIRVSGNGSNWKPWVTYDKGLEIGQCSS